MNLLKAFFVSLFSFIFFTSEVLACSMTRDYVRPSNFELVQFTDIIIVGKIISGTVNGRMGSTKIEVERVIKGHPLPKYITLDLAISKVPPSTRDQIYSSHPYNSACNRYEVEKGHSYVFFMNEYKEKLGLYNNPAFSRITEDYYGEGSLWMKAINYYLDVQNSHSPMVQIDVLKEKFYAIQKEKNAAEHDQLLAVDIATHLMSRSEYKPTQYLIDSYMALDMGKELGFRVSSPKTYHGNPHMESMLEMLFGQKALPISERKKEMEFILWSLANGKHPAAKDFMLKLIAKPKAEAVHLGAAVRYLSNHGQYREAVELVKMHGINIASHGTAHEVREFFHAALRIHDNKADYKKPKWLQVEEVRAWWPRFALTIEQIMTSRKMWSDWRVISELELGELRPKNYREYPDLAYLLVDEYDDEVVDWAKQEIKQLLADEVGTHKEDYALPIGIILRDYNNYNKKDYVEDLFCRSKDTRYLLLKNIGYHVDTYTDDLVRQFALFKGYDEEEKNTLIKSLIRFEAKEEDSAVDLNEDLDRYSQPYDFIYYLMHGTIPKLKKLKPIQCD